MVAHAFPPADESDRTTSPNSANGDSGNVVRLAGSNADIAAALRECKAPTRNLDTARQRVFQLCGDIWDNKQGRNRQGKLDWEAIYKTLTAKGIIINKEETLRRYATDAKRAVTRFIKQQSQALCDRLAEGESIDSIIEYIKAETGVGLTHAMLKTLLPPSSGLAKIPPSSGTHSPQIADRLEQGTVNKAAGYFPN